MSYLEAMKVSCAETLMWDTERAVTHILSGYLQQKLLRLVSKKEDPEGREAHFHLAIGKRPALDYYKNSGIGPFVPAAMTSLAILTLDAFQFASDDLHDHYRFMQYLFQNEFSFPGILSKGR